MQSGDIVWPVPRAELVSELKKILAGQDPSEITFKTVRKTLEKTFSVKFTKPMRKAMHDIVVQVLT